MDPLPRIVRLGTSRRAFWLLAGGFFVADLISKSLCFWLTDGGLYGRWIVSKVIGIQPAINHGAAFSMLDSVPGSRYILVFINVALLGMLLQMARQAAFAPVWWAIAMVVGGAAANLVDRVYYGYVRDFLKVAWWPTFNIADIGITVGVVMLLIHLMRSDASGRGKRSSSEVDSIEHTP